MTLADDLIKVCTNQNVSLDDLENLLDARHYTLYTKLCDWIIKNHDYIVERVAYALPNEVIANGFFDVWSSKEF